MKKQAIIAIILAALAALGAITVVIVYQTSNKQQERKGSNISETIIIEAVKEPVVTEMPADEPPEEDEEILPAEPPEDDEEILPAEPPEDDEPFVFADAPAEDVDPYEILRISEAEARERGGYYVRRDGQLYMIDEFKAEEGRRGHFGDRQYLTTGIITDCYYVEKGGAYLSIGNVPMMTLKPGDELISFNVDFIGPLHEMNFEGYSIPILLNERREGLIFEDFDQAPIKMGLGTWEKVEVYDSDGNLVENYRNLPFGETYTTGWFWGATYNENVLISDCSYYSETDVTYSKIEGELHKESYASFDLSGIPSGIYRFRGSFIGVTAFIRIEN